MRIIFLGTGTSTGIPEVGCYCTLCQSRDRHDRRSRTSALIITDEGKRILIDCGQDFRQQALSIGLDRVDAILITHEHVDHVGGLDDLRTIAWASELPIYAQPNVLEAIRKRLPYVFTDKPYPGTPRFVLHAIESDEPFDLFGLKITPIELMHGNLPILGYRLGDITYITDLKTISPEEWSKVSGSRLVVINALRHSFAHPSHQSIQDAFSLISSLETRPEKTLLTHLSHHAPLHQQIVELCPEDIAPAYDNLVADVTPEGIELSDFVLPPPALVVKDLGRVQYVQAWQMQRSIFEETIRRKMESLPTQSELLLCEHNPVFTIGKHGDEANLLVREELLRSQGFEYHHVERGGDITYHGPGQITGYPILDLEAFGLGLKAYIDLMEEVIIRLLKFFGIQGERNPKATGVWIEPTNPRRARKICAIGVRSSRYVTMHGFALNVNTDLKPFQLINPCGFVDGQVSSIATELGVEEVDMTMVKAMLAKYFVQALSNRLPDKYLSGITS